MIDADETFAKGGKELIQLLEFCISSVQLEGLFVVLAGDYRIAPTPAKLLALYDEFCAPRAPARLKVKGVGDLRFAAAVEKVRAAVNAAKTPPPEGEPPPPPVFAERSIFDGLIAELKAPEGPVRKVAAGFDPAKSVSENLPGGRMSAGQRAFKEQVWQRGVRPRLVAAGFHRAAPLGG